MDFFLSFRILISVILLQKPSVQEFFESRAIPPGEIKKAEHTKDSSFGSSAILFIKTRSLPLASNEEIGSFEKEPSFLMNNDRSSYDRG